MISDAPFQENGVNAGKQQCQCQALPLHLGNPTASQEIAPASPVSIATVRSHTLILRRCIQTRTLREDMRQDT
eukprot:1308265-Prorocentrum_lima.AAC.1